ncbi:MAG: DUF2752 domain-containing protein [Chloroflexi bacterium]|nr:DUF2752 domain-containing protein [Chloroflexota bacterium]
MAEAVPRVPLGDALRPLAEQAFRPALIGMAGLTAGALLPPDWVLHGPQLCIFKLMSGLPCPGCGLTRAVVLLMHGDLTGSLYYHPLAVFLVLAALLLVAVDAYAWWRAHPGGLAATKPSWLLEWLSKTPAPWVLIGLMLALWAVRLPLYLVGSWVY